MPDIKTEIEYKRERFQSSWMPYIVECMLEKGLNFEVKIESEQSVYFSAERRYFQVPSQYSVTIKYDELEITNSNNQTHIITDLYVKFYVSHYISSGSIIADIQGARETYQESEANVQYRHSHLECGRTGQFGNFCIGDSYLAQFGVEHYITPSKEGAQLFFMLLDQLIHWESLEGGPYIRMENIHPYACDGYIENLPELLPINTDYIDFRILEDGRVDVNDSWIQEQLEPNCVVFNGGYYSGILNRTDEELEEYEENINQEQFRIAEEDDEDGNFEEGDEFDDRIIYKGKIISTKVIRDKKKYEDITEKIVHPELIRRYARELNNKIETWLLKKVFVEKTIQNGVITQSVGTSEMVVA